MTPSMGSVLYFSGQQLHGGAPVLSGVRYILAGFCEYESHPSRLVGSTDVENKLAALTSFEDLEHEIFLAEYNSTHDGAAADAGFRTGDLIVGIEVCEQVPSLQDVKQHVSRRMVNITSGLQKEKWISYATSCERLEPGSDTVIVVQRGD
jgi:hypothetical protein